MYTTLFRARSWDLPRSATSRVPTAIASYSLFFCFFFRFRYFTSCRLGWGPTRLFLINELEYLLERGMQANMQVLPIIGAGPGP